MKSKFLLLVYLGLTMECCRAVVRNVSLDSNMDGHTPIVQTGRRKRAGSPGTDATPECGKPVSEVYFATGGTTVLIQQNPWHAGVYLRDTSGDFQQVCGATLITTTAVISAAHCFYDESYKRFHNIGEYKIGLGKQYRTWTNDDDQEERVQRRDIAELFTPRRYTGVRTHFIADVALVVLDSPVEITASVNVICVDWNNRFEEEHLVEENYGQAVGWGKFQNGSSSDTLQGVFLPYVPFDTCFDALTPNARDVYTPDKFCAGHKDKNISVCQGDSGGGLVFPRSCDNRKYLRGIVSVSFKPRHNNDPCYAQLFTGFTRLSEYVDWIKGFIDLEETARASKPSPLCEKKLKAKPGSHRCPVPKSEQMCMKFAIMVKSNISGEYCDLLNWPDKEKRHPSEPKVFPHVVSLGTGNRQDNIQWTCDGSLISERYVLTAAHCFDKRPCDWVRLGDWNLVRPSVDGTARQQLIKAAETIKHYGYTSSLLYHDIALVRLKEAAVINEFVRPACLDSEPLETAEDFVVSGFGRDTYESERRQQLMYGMVRHVDTSSCNKNYSSVVNLQKLTRLIDHNTMICFKPVAPETDCVARGGAPIVTNTLAPPLCMHRVMGMTSFGPARCGTTDRPFVTTRVYFYRTWVESIVWPDIDF